MADKLSIIEDIQTEFMKLYNECKKKYTSIKEAIDETLSKLNEIKTNLQNANKSNQLSTSEISKQVIDEDDIIVKPSAG